MYPNCSNLEKALQHRSCQRRNCVRGSCTWENTQFSFIFQQFILLPNGYALPLFFICTCTTLLLTVDSAALFRGPVSSRELQATLRQEPHHLVSRGTHHNGSKHSDNFWLAFTVFSECENVYFWFPHLVRMTFPMQVLRRKMCVRMKLYRGYKKF